MLGEPGGNGLHFRVGLRQRHAGLQSCNGVNTGMLIAMTRTAQGVLMAPERTEKGIIPPGTVKLGIRNNADHRINLSVQNQFLAEDVWIPGKFSGPIPVAKQYLRGRAHFVVVWSEPASENRLDSQGRKKVRSDL